MTNEERRTTNVELRASDGGWDQDWRDLIRGGINSVEELTARFEGIDAEEVRRVTERYPVRINGYWLSRIRSKEDPFYRQAVPDAEELRAGCGMVDPLHEDDPEDSPVPNLTHRYPDRVLLLVNYQCPIYCRFCMRKRKVGRPETFSTKYVDQGIAYIRAHPEVRDVLLSGGDPLLLSDIRIAYLLRELRAIPHVEIVRVGTKVPCALPQRITPGLCAVLKRYAPVYVNTHFNHPDEVTPEAKRACEMLADAGVPVSNQCVLLKGINDDAETIRRLMHRLLMIRVKPYYLFQGDLVQGADHFRTPLSKGLEIIAALWGRTSGMAVPHFAVDAPGGGGKVPLFPKTLVGFEDGKVRLRNYEGETYVYPDPMAEEANRPFHV